MSDDIHSDQIMFNVHAYDILLWITKYMMMRMMMLMMMMVKMMILIEDRAVKSIFIGCWRKGRNFPLCHSHQNICIKSSHDDDDDDDGGSEDDDENQNDDSNIVI